jgi:DnaK suppressor protein
MTASERDAFRRQLLAMQDRLNGSMSHLAEEALGPADGEGTSNLSHVPLHMADLASDSFEHDNTLSLLANEKQMVEEIVVALRRLDDGTYGKCEGCQASIPRDRLREVPYTRYCVACAKKAEPQRS